MISDPKCQRRPQSSCQLGWRPPVFLASCCMKCAASRSLFGRPSGFVRSPPSSRCILRWMTMRCKAACALLASMWSCTRADHPSGTDRLAEANAAVGAAAVINVQGDEPLVTGEQIRALAAGLQGGAAMSTLAIPFERPEDFANPNQVKVVRDRAGNALYFSRSPMPFARDCRRGGRRRMAGGASVLPSFRAVRLRCRLSEGVFHARAGFSGKHRKARAAPRDGARLSHSRRHYRPADDRH